MNNDDDHSCEWCGSDGWLDFELDNGKCKICIVNDCNHENQDIFSGEMFLYRTIPKIIVHHVCLDCELSWEYEYKLVNGVRSTLTHEEVNSSDIYQDVKV